MDIVEVTAKNRSLFEQMVPEEFFEPLGSKYHYVLGAIGEDEEGLYAAGVLVFDTKEGSIDEDVFIVGFLQWLYVAPEFRDRGAGKALVDACLDLLSTAQVEIIMCDLLIDLDYLEVAEYLEKWGFVFETTVKPELRVRMRELRKIPELWKTPPKNILSFRKASREQIREAFQKAVRVKNIAADLPVRMKYCDRDISCIAYQNGIPVGMSLVCPLASDIVELVYLRMFSNEPKLMTGMIHFVAGRIRKKYGPDTEIRFTCRKDSIAKVIEMMLPDAEPLMVYRGVCTTAKEE